MTTGTEIPPRRRWLWSVLFLAIALVAGLWTLDLPRFVEAVGLDHVSEIGGYVVARIARAIAWTCVFLWFAYLPSRLLISAVVRTGADDPLVVRSSRSLTAAVKELNGVVVGLSSMPATTFLVFVDLGTEFELWRWHHHRPQCVLRMRWAQVDSIEVDVVDRGLRTERGIVLGHLRNGHLVRLPLLPHRRGAVRMRPARGAALEAVERRFRSRLQDTSVGSDLGAEPNAVRHEGGVENDVR